MPMSCWSRKLSVGFDWNLMVKVMMHQQKILILKMCVCFIFFTWIWLFFIHIFGLGSLSITRHTLLHSITGHHDTAFQIFWTISELKFFSWFSFFWLIKHRIVLGDMFSVSYETYIDTHFVSYLWAFFVNTFLPFIDSRIT